HANLPRRVRIRVPATTANLGPGFDCLGMALDIHDDVYVSIGEMQQAAEAGLEGQYHALVRLAAGRFFQAVGQEPPSLVVSSERRIPLGRGLGSSAAAIVAGVLGANALAGGPLDSAAVADLAAAIEGHPDNSTPCLYGGLQVCVMDGERLAHAQVPLAAELTAALYVPDFPLPTHETRKLLPAALSRADVVFQTSRTALLVAALATGQVEHLRLATQDRLHQPARGSVFPAMWGLFDAALEAGALCAYLSGGGPTVLALALGDARPVSKAMEQKATSLGIKGEARMARPSAAGARVLEVG
ncbi:MAG: homoserine kinase, partial [Chloroflexi bacterium]|nr:homoserine kinase [Chloroflexota bacterium]